MWVTLVVGLDAEDCCNQEQLATLRCAQDQRFLVRDRRRWRGCVLLQHAGKLILPWAAMFVWVKPR
jgi:hypothetical protein